MLVAEGFSSIDDIKDSTPDAISKIEGIEEETAKELIERAKEFYQKDQEEISNRIKDLGLESELINHKGLTPGMLLTLGEQNILKFVDFADLASDELTGSYDIVKGERIKIKGYLEDFALSKNEADELIMSARNKIYKDWEMKYGKKKTKLTISGNPKKSINNIELAKSQNKNSVVIEKKPSRFSNRSPFKRSSGARPAGKNTGFKSNSFSSQRPQNISKPSFPITNDYEKRKLAEQRATRRLKGQ